MRTCPGGGNYFRIQREWGYGNRESFFEKLEKMGCDEASRNLVKILWMERELEASVDLHQFEMLYEENEQLKGIINKHCVGKTIVSVCNVSGRNLGSDRQTYTDLSCNPCCDEHVWEEECMHQPCGGECRYMEIDQWAKTYRVDIKKLKESHDARMQAQTSTPLYTETDPSPTLPDDNDE